MPIETTQQIMRTETTSSRRTPPKRKDIRKNTRVWKGKNTLTKYQRAKNIRHNRDEKSFSIDYNRMPEQTSNNEEWMWSPQDKAPKKQRQYSCDFEIHYHHVFYHYHQTTNTNFVEHTNTSTTTIPPMDFKCGCKQPNPHTHYHHYRHHHLKKPQP